MNKKLLTTIGLSVLVLCAAVFVAGCEKKADATTGLAAIKACVADCSKPCCAAEANAACAVSSSCADKAKACAASSSCGAKPACGAVKACSVAAADTKTCPADPAKPCCAAKTATDAVEDVVTSEPK